MKDTIKGLLLPPGPAPRTVVAGVARGVRMQIDFSHQTRLYLGVYELELDRHLRHLLRPGMAAFDVGAQFGYDSLAIAKRTKARVAAFECDAAAITQMQASVCLNPRLRPLIEPVHAVIGDAGDQLGLDEWAYGPGFIPDFIKLDIEGGEVSALRSASRLLQEHHPALVVEVHGLALERESGELLAAFGYRPIVVSQRRAFPDRRPTDHNRWLVASRQEAGPRTNLAP